MNTYEIQIKSAPGPDAPISVITLSAIDESDAAHKVWKEAIKRGLHDAELGPLMFKVKLISDHKENQ